MDEGHAEPSAIRIAELELALRESEQRLSECLRQVESTAAELERSRAELRHRVEQMTRAESLAATGYWEADLVNGKVLWSGGMSRLLGFPAEPQQRGVGELYGFVHPDDVEPTRRAVDQGLKSGSYSAEFRARNVSGEEHHVRITGEVTFADGKPVASFGVGQDISALKRSESALGKSEHHSRRQARELELIYATAPVGLCVLDEQLRFVHVNERLAEINGLPVQAHLGRTVGEVVPAIARIGEPYLRRVLETGEPATDLEFSGEVPGRPGVTRTFISHYWPLFDEGRVTGINVVVEEVTSQRLLEESSRAEREFRALAENSPDLITRFDRGLRRVYANPPVGELLGRPREALIGKTNEEIGLPPTLAAHWQRVLNRAFEKGEVQMEEIYVRTPSGERVLDSRIIPEFAPDGTVQTLLVVSRDVTERKRFETALRESEERYRRQAAELETIYGHAPIGLTVLDTGLHYLRINERLAEMNGAPAAQHMGRTVGEMVPALAAFAERAARQVVETGEPLLNVEIRGEIPATGGKEGIWNVQWVPIKDVDGVIWGINVVVEDITDRKHAEELLIRREREFEALVERSPDLVARVDRESRLLYVNPVVERLSGRPRGWFLGKRPSEMQLSAHEAEVRELAVREVVESGQERALEHQHRTPDGLRYFHARLVPEFDSEGRVASVFIVDRDISDLKRAQMVLEDLSLHDPLTGLANRRYLSRFIDREWRREARHRRSVAVVMADIDFFKAFNDHYGHQRGDECLREVSRALGDTLRRPTDMLVRYGGEEFAVILLESDLQAARQLADTMLNAVMARHLEHAASPVAPVVTISMGVTAAPANHVSFDELLDAADAALYRAKQNGRNRVETGALPDRHG